MSRATKRKHVVQQLLEERVQPGEGQSVVRVLGTPGNNLHEVETAEGTRFLASMPPRFRRHIWIKRGDFLLVDPIQEGSKVKAEISLVLLPPHVRSLQRQGLWPEAFAPLERKNRQGDGSGDLFVNTNRGGTPGDTGDSSGDSEGDTGDSGGDTDGDTDGDSEEDTGDSDGGTGDSDGDTKDSDGDTKDNDGGTGDTKDSDGGTKDTDGGTGDTNGDTGDNDSGHTGDTEATPRTKDSGDRGDRGHGDSPQ
ncbi:probable RNA-binding protein EIF1AD [Catharus ustulatus]|uniref:probable RNA-binding protein EIF1AD n=1 Tax=Catharus ustulatus TaxID=91951 RepID=UPI001408BDDA|nr:probable RNA-binding protein EIF1AD [Catharus ustulatus]